MEQTTSIEISLRTSIVIRFLWFVTAIKLYQSTKNGAHAHLSVEPKAGACAQYVREISYRSPQSRPAHSTDGERLKIDRPGLIEAEGLEHVDLGLYRAWA